MGQDIRVHWKSPLGRYSVWIVAVVAVTERKEASHYSLSSQRETSFPFRGARANGGRDAGRMDSDGGKAEEGRKEGKSG